MHELLEANTDGKLNSTEQSELETLVHMAEFGQINLSRASAITPSRESHAFCKSKSVCSTFFRLTRSGDFHARILFIFLAGISFAACAAEPVVGVQTSDSGIKHSFLVCGDLTAIIGEDSSTVFKLLMARAMGLCWLRGICCCGEQV